MGSNIIKLEVGKKVLLQDQDTKLWTHKGTIVQVRPKALSCYVQLENGNIYLRNSQYIKEIPNQNEKSENLKKLF